ncbi:hypothetical protein Scep_004489 [Stephania cephalantha]|uniref:Uncharacterized protein n=1 Tax=Stephania cephalantha TaxID=152367 RepID=A0AAP0PWP9_9MAGN
MPEMVPRAEFDIVVEQLRKVMAFMHQQFGMTMDGAGLSQSQPPPPPPPHDQQQPPQIDPTDPPQQQDNVEREMQEWLTRDEQLDYYEGMYMKLDQQIPMLRVKDKHLTKLLRGEKWLPSHARDERLMSFGGADCNKCMIGRFYLNFLLCPISSSLLSSLASIDWKSFGLNVKSSAIDEDGDAVLEWENLPPLVHISHCKAAPDLIYGCVPPLLLSLLS